MYNLYIAKMEEDQQIVIFDDKVQDLEITTYNDSVELDFSLNNINFHIEYNKKDNVKMSIWLV